MALLPPQQQHLSRHRAWSFAHFMPGCVLRSLNLDEGEFTEGHELDRKWRVAQEMIGRRLSQEEAKRLLAKLG